jgi:hypothetical protein
MWTPVTLRFVCSEKGNHKDREITRIEFRFWKSICGSDKLQKLVAVCTSEGSESMEASGTVTEASYQASDQLLIFRHFVVNANYVDGFVCSVN